MFVNLLFAEENNKKTVMCLVLVKNGILMIQIVCLIVLLKRVQKKTQVCVYPSVGSSCIVQTRKSPSLSQKVIES
jgi:hypothetical protein